MMGAHTPWELLLPGTSTPIDAMSGMYDRGSLIGWKTDKPSGTFTLGDMIVLDEDKKKFHKSCWERDGATGGLRMKKLPIFYMAPETHGVLNWIILRGVSRELDRYDERNADPDVVSDILLGLGDIVRERLPYGHAEGNSPAHIKSSVIGAAMDVFVKGGELVLGTWQGIYFCEFDGPRKRRLFVKVVSDL